MKYEDLSCEYHRGGIKAENITCGKYIDTTVSMNISSSEDFFCGSDYATATIGSQSLRADICEKAGLSLFLCIYLHTPGDKMEIAHYNTSQ